MPRSILAALVLVLAWSGAALAQVSADSTAPPPGGTYLFRAARERTIIYLRLPDQPRGGPTVLAWKTLYLRQPLGEGDELTIYGAALDEYDCEAMRIRTLRTSTFGPTDNLIASKTTDGEWREIKPNTNAEFDRALVCTGKPLSGDDNPEPLIGTAAWRADAAARVAAPG